MAGPEDDRFRFPDDTEPRVPVLLPPELAAFLKDQDFACVTQATDQRTAYVFKAPAAAIAAIRGTIPIQLRHALYTHPAAR